MTREQIIEIINDQNEARIVAAWNGYCEEMSMYDGFVHSNDNDGYTALFGDNLDEAIRAAYYGEFNYIDDYCYLDGYGNLSTFTHIGDTECIIDTDTLADYFEEHQDEMEDYFNFDPEDYEEDDDDAEIICPRCGERLKRGDYEYDSESGDIVVTTCPNCFYSGPQAEVVDSDDIDDDDDDDDAYHCPKCGARLEQGDYEYDYDSGRLIVVSCPECECEGEPVSNGDPGDSNE